MHWPTTAPPEAKPGKLVQNLELPGKVEADLAKKYSPEQIAGPVEGRVSRSAGDAGEHRNHLPGAVCAIPRRPETGPDQVFENRPGSTQALPQTRATQEPHP